MKINTKYIRHAILLFAMLISSCVFAQEELVLKDLQSLQITQKYEIARGMVSDAANQTYISQIGDGNQSLILQDARNVGGENIILLFQNGNFNTAHAIQKGYNNELKIVQQGNANETAISAEGELLRMATSQYGDFNKVLQQVTGINANYTIEQYGNNNTIEQKGDSFSKGLSITQYGSNMNITIERISLFK